MNSSLKFLVTAALVCVTVACEKKGDDPEEPYQDLEAVDPGLSVKWVSYNVCAHSVNGRGFFLTWNSSRGGYVVKGIKTGNAIFLPAAGYRDGEKYKTAGTYGCYWTSTLYRPRPINADFLYFNSGEHTSSYVQRYYGISVRSVYNGKD